MLTSGIDKNVRRDTHVPMRSEYGRGAGVRNDKESL